MTLCGNVIGVLQHGQMCSSTMKIYHTFTIKCTFKVKTRILTIYCSLPNVDIYWQIDKYFGQKVEADTNKAVLHVVAIHGAEY